MPTSVTGYRLVMIYVVVWLLAFVLAFTAITILGRRHWLTIASAESLVARMSGSAVLALIALGSLSGVVTSLIFPLTPPFDAGVDPTQVRAARLQAEVGIVIALALTAAAAVRVEASHRRVASRGVKPDAEEWEVDEPEAIHRRP